MVDEPLLLTCSKVRIFINVYSKRVTRRMIAVYRIGKKFRSGLLAACLIMASTVGVLAGELTWKDEILSVKYRDADLRDVLSDILRRNGKTAVFMPGIPSAPFSFDFLHNPTPIKSAFKKILAEYNLGYEVDHENVLVRIVSYSNYEVVDNLFTPKYGDMNSILDAFKRFDAVKGADITADYASNVIFFHGEKKEVETLLRIAKEVDASLQNQHEAQLKKLEWQVEVLEQQRLKCVGP